MAERIVQFAAKALAVVSGGFALIMTFLIFADVIMRHFFNSPIPSVLEISEGILMPYLVFGALAVADHVRVTLVLSALTSKARRVVLSAGYLLSILFFAVMDWRSVGALIGSIRSGESAETYFSFPIYIGRIAVVVGITLLILVLLFRMLTTLKESEITVEITPAE